MLDQFENLQVYLVDAAGRIHDFESFRIACGQREESFSYLLLVFLVSLLDSVGATMRAASGAGLEIDIEDDGQIRLIAGDTKISNLLDGFCTQFAGRSW